MVTLSSPFSTDVDQAKVRAGTGQSRETLVEWILNIEFVFQVDQFGELPLRPWIDPLSSSSTDISVFLT